MQRRRFLATAAALAAGPAAAEAPLMRAIARSGERVPVVGLGTWLTFDVAPDDGAALERRRAVLEAFFAGGGRLIDSSPMYGRSEATLGALLPQVAAAKTALYSATKVWTPLGAYGPTQMAHSLAAWGLARCDLMLVHNILNAEAHLPTLRRWRAEGRVRHLGLSTSHGNKHEAMRGLLESEHDLDVLQITYNPVDRRAEPLMALAAARGMAVIVNRPFDGGHLLRRLRGVPLPPLAAELGCSTWAPLVLKWELAHPAVACAIPASTDPAHVAENLQALRGPLPDARQRDALTIAIDKAIG